MVAAIIMVEDGRRLANTYLYTALCNPSHFTLHRSKRPRSYLCDFVISPINSLTFKIEKPPVLGGVLVGFTSSHSHCPLHTQKLFHNRIQFC
jgi:hypothetical protein